MSKYNILITGTGGCGVGEGLYKSLKNIDKYTIFTCNSSDNSLFIFDLPERSFIVPKAQDENYCEVIIEICKKNNIKVVIPGSEHELVVLVDSRALFDKEEITIFANTNDVIKTFDSKWETFIRLSDLDIKTPDTTLDINDTEFFKRNSYPVILKPIYGNGSKNIFVIESEEELFCMAKYLNIKGVNFVVQEYIGNANEEYTISVLSDLEGNYLGSIVFKRLLAGGFSQFIECESFDELDLIAQRISQQVNSKGPLNIQCRLVNDILYVFEINPRFSGTSPFRALLGFNEVDILFEKMFEGTTNFDKNKIQVGSFGVRGFQEKVYSKEIKSKVTTFN